MKYLFVLFVLIFFLFCGYSQKDKINGMSLVSINKPLSKKHIDPLVHIHSNYAAVIPFGFKSTINGTSIAFDLQNQWYGETSAGIKSTIKLLQDQDIKIMLKPQIWVWNGSYTGDIKMKNEEDWLLLEAAYTKFITLYAQIAADAGVELFCVGTELKQFAASRPEYWRTLIKDIRVIYKGKLTYAANWDEYVKVRFWEDLDYIGIDAYFPVSFKRTPSVTECKKGWKKNFTAIKYLAKAYDKKILFTEFGYRSVDYTGKEPWNSHNEIAKVNLEGQKNATQALMELFWNQDWFAGGFLWKWFPENEKAGGVDDSRFTPQNKPVLEVVKSFYNNYSASPENK
ncbi:MAG: hypothetical protein ACI8Q1_000727 [Parvicella sp.]|jgi:hypothetical protein